MSALDTLWEQQKDASYKEGIHQGQQEAFAASVIYGEVTVFGQVVRVSFEWPDDLFAQQVREVSRTILERAHREGRQAEPPPEV